MADTIPLAADQSMEVHARAVADARLDRIAARVFRRFVPFLMVCYVVAYLDRVNIGFAKMAMSADIGLSEFAYGLGAGVFFIGYFLFEVPSNILLERFGARRWICRIMLTWAVLSAAFAFVRSTEAFYALRFVLGIAEAGFFPGVLLFLSQWFPAARRGQIIAMFMAAIPLAGLVGSPLSGSIMAVMDGVAGLEGWRWMFLLEAAPAFLLGIATLFVLDSRIADAAWLGDDDKALLTKTLAGEEPQADKQQGKCHKGVLAAMLDPGVLTFAFIYFCCIMGQYGVTFWLPTLVSAAGATGTLDMGLFTAIPYAVAIVVMIATGRHSDHTGERRWHVFWPMMAGGILLVATTFLSTSFALAMVLMSLATAAVLTATPMFWTLPTQALSGRAAVVGIAAINSVGNLAGFLSPIVVGWISQTTGSTANGMAALAACLFAGALVVATKPALTR